MLMLEVPSGDCGGRLLGEITMPKSGFRILPALVHTVEARCMHEGLHIRPLSTLAR